MELFVPISGKNLVREFEKHGWIIDRIKSSHYILRKNDRTVSIPVHGSKDLGIGIEKKLRKLLSK